MKADKDFETNSVVLVVEDDDLIREVTSAIIEDGGYTTIQATNADQAISILDSRSDISLVVTDINMSGSMDGLKLAHAIRGRWPPVRIIVVSGKVHPEPDELPSATFFVKKPFKGEELLAAIERFAA